VAVLRLKLLGLNRKQVNIHLQQLSTTHTQVLAEVKEKIQQCRREREQLDLERVKIKALSLDAEDLALLELAGQRVQLAVKHIRDGAAEDSALFATEVKEKIKLLEKQVLEIEEDIKLTNSQINLESISISRCLVHSRAEVQPQVKKELQGKINMEVKTDADKAEVESSRSEAASTMEAEKAGAVVEDRIDDPRQK